MRRLGHQVGTKRRIDEDLGSEIDLFAAQERRGHRHEVAPGRVPPRRVARREWQSRHDARPRSAASSTASSRPAGKGFSAQSVVDGEEARVRVVGESTAQPVVGFQIAHDKIAAVKVTRPDAFPSSISGTYNRAASVRPSQRNCRVAGLYVTRNISAEARAHLEMLGDAGQVRPPAATARGSRARRADTVRTPSGSRRLPPTH